MKLSQEQIDKIYKISDRCVKGIILIGLVVVFLKPGNWFWWVFFILLILSMLVNVISNHFATDEEKAEFKKAVKDAVREEREAEVKKKRKAHQDRSDMGCPLIDVNDKQKEEIIELLKHRITKHIQDDTRFNRSVVYAYLTALRSAHIINPVKTDDDKDERRIWIEQITKLYEPQSEWAHFRGDYDEFKKTKRARDAKKEIEYILEKFR